MNKLPHLTMIVSNNSLLISDKRYYKICIGQNNVKIKTSAFPENDFAYPDVFIIKMQIPTNP